MRTPTVTETPLKLSPVERDTFIGPRRGEPPYPPERRSRRAASTNRSASRLRRSV
jgi:hypothetical protein